MSDHKSVIVDRAWLKDALSLRSAGVVYAFILIVVVLTIATAATGRPSYLSPANIANLLEQASLVAILAIFMTVVLLSGNFDLSVASTSALSAAVLLLLIDQYGFALAFVAALTAGVSVGAFNGLIVYYVGINAFIVTLGTLTGVRGLVLILTDARTITATDPAARAAMQTFQGGRIATPNLLWVAAAGVLIAALALYRRSHRAAAILLLAGALALSGAGVVFDASLPLAKSVYYLMAIVLVVWALLRFTVMGRRLYATGGNAESARLSGINVARYKVMPFVLIGLSAGFVGSLFAAKLGAVNPTALQGMELTVIAAAILGGTSLFGGSGSVAKSVVGALILFTLANGFNVLNLGATYQGVIEGAVLVTAAAVYTIAGRRASEHRDDTEDPVIEAGGAETPASTDGVGATK